MSDEVSSTSPLTPLIRRVVEEVKGLVATDAMVGGRLPPERDLARDLAVSRATVRKALTYLAEQGMLTPAPQSGWYVSATPLSAPPQKLISFTDLAARRGQSVHTRLVSSQLRLPGFEEREFLRAPDRAPVLELIRIRSVAGRPACLDKSVLPSWRIPGLAEVDWNDTSLYSELERRGITPTRSDFVVEAALAGTFGEPLEIDPGDPVAKIRERCYDQYGGPALLGFAIYRADNYRFHATLTAAR